MKVNVQQMTVREIQRQYGVSQATAYRAKDRGYLLLQDDGQPRTANQGRAAKEIVPKGFALAEKDAQRIARLSAQYVVGRQRVFNTALCQWVRDNDLFQEAYQCALIRLWTHGADSEALAFDVCRKAALNALRGWRSKLAAFYDELEPEDVEDTESDE